MKKYNFKTIEDNWRDKWYDDNIYKAVDFSDKPKKYILAEWPYPSGKMIHVGHAMRYTVPEVYSRFLRMKGYNVLFPMGWDAFGLPTEGYALKQNRTPQEVTDELTTDYKKAMNMMGYAFDWSRETNSTDPAYYKWTQWLFLKFYEHGLAELKEMPVWWCKELGNLADEEILTDSEGNKISERGSHKVVRKNFKQWVLKIPEYAEKLLEGLNEVDYPDHIKTAQRNWIGKSEGAYIDFDATTPKEKVDTIRVFTTRPDTIFGVTFMALAAEHPLVARLIEFAENADEVKVYVDKAKNLSDMEKQTLKDKTGVEVKGIHAVHPLTKKGVPIFITNYVLIDVGTGALMGVPAHDERDNEFAKNYDLPIIEVIDAVDKGVDEVYTGSGSVINSGEYNGLNSEEFKDVITNKLSAIGKGETATTYKIRDWVFSRQHYWGEPMPFVYKQDGGVEPLVKSTNMAAVNEKLPLKLPHSTSYEPLEDGSAPLARVTDWVSTVDAAGNAAMRETQTMPTWAGSSWYFLRFIDPNNDKEFATAEKLKYWLPVDMYFGGAEHTTVHLLYSRFWHKFFYDIGIVPTPEPYQWRMNGGLLLAADGKKMSKRLGNVVEPGKMIEKYGADATRMAICFLGPYTATYPWNEGSIRATYKLLATINEFEEKVVQENETNPEVLKGCHRLVKNVEGMMGDLKMNTGVSEIMIFTNQLKTVNTIGRDVWEMFIKVLAPFAPFIAEDLWQKSNEYETWVAENSVHLQPWPTYDEKLLIEDTITLAIQVNGKIRDEVVIPADAPENEIKSLVLEREKVQAYLEGKELKKYVYVKGRLVSLVV